MNTPLSWIKAYVPGLTCTDQEYSDRMTMTGTKVEKYTRLDANLEKIVVGEIVQIDRHPDADKLVVCRVRVVDKTEDLCLAKEEITDLAEDGTVQIVTGATNVEVGQRVPVVLAGGRVAAGHGDAPKSPEGVIIKAGKLRGVPSVGMLCSVEELGATRDQYPDAPEDGIYIFSADAETG